MFKNKKWKKTMQFMRQEKPRASLKTRRELATIMVQLEHGEELDLFSQGKIKRKSLWR